MSSINKVQIIGRLGRDPDIRHDKNANKIVAFSVATSEYWFDKTLNERKEKVEWHKVVIFNDKLADIANQYLRKGSLVYLEGQIQTREWYDNNGAKHYTTEIVLPRFKGEILMLGSTGENQEEENKKSEKTPLQHSFEYARDFDSSFNKKSTSYAHKNEIELNDEIPF